MFRQTFSMLLPGPSSNAKKIMVVGLPRSGTSWLAKALSLATGVSYYFEPDYCLPKEYVYKYLAENDQDDFLNQFLANAFAGKVYDEYVIAEQGFLDILKRPLTNAVLLKCVHLPLTLDWFAKTFPDVVVVQLVRHPVPLFLSWKQRGWGPKYQLDKLLQQTELMDGPLQNYKATLQNAETYWEIAGAFWSSIVYMQLQQQKDNWYMYEHEWFCHDSVTRINELVNKLGLQWSTAIESFLVGKGIESNKAGPGYGLWRDPKKEINKWQDKISSEELSQLKHVVDQFNIPFYPDLEISVEEPVMVKTGATNNVDIEGG